MYKYIGLFILPFFFNTLVFIAVNNFNLKDDKFELTLKNKIISINIHLNSHKNFESADKLYLKNKYNSSQINKIYSKKLIDKDFVLETSIKKNIFNKSIEQTLVSPIQFSKIQLSNYDWKQMFSKKKIVFIETLLPIIILENKKILNERKKIIEIKKYLQAEKTLIDIDIIYINQIAKKYQIKSTNKHKIDLLDELLTLVDIIPNSIVLAQAVNESGWGTSRFAKEYNALFGQYTYKESEGIIPFEREEGKKHLIKNFSSFDKSVESYFRNLNTHYAYKKFRKIRSQINKKDLLINIKLLTQTLDVYAEDEFYVDTINSIIDSNKFNQFDGLINPFVNS